MNQTQQQAKNLLRLPWPFQRLQWQLTRDYLLVTVLMVTTLQLVFYAATMGLLLSFFRSPQFPARIAQALHEATPQLRPHLATYAQNPQPLTQMMQQFVFDADLAWEPGGLQFVFHHHFQGVADERNFLDNRVRLVCVTDPHGKVLAAAGAFAAPVGAALPSLLPSASQTLLRNAQRGETDPAQLAVKTAARELLAVAPLHDAATGQVSGLFWSYIEVSLGWDLFVGLLQDFLPQLTLVPLLGLLIGLSFGTLTARQLTRRFNQLAHAAERWGQGELTARAPTQPPDELGLLGARLNQMASDLESKLALQQTLATMEERNRLARDLHDTIKQQLFACAMQLSAAQRTLATPPLAQQHLDEAAELARQMQQELTEVIHELAPPQQPQRGFLRALRELTAVWARQSGVHVQWEPAEPPPAAWQFSPTTERTLLRIVQEALANCARHSRATHFRLEFHLTATGFQLRLHDDGQGFEPATVIPGVGLQSMRERAATLPQGRCVVQSQPGHGTTIELSWQQEHRDG